MNALELLQHPEISELVKKQEEVNRQKAKAGYNLFTISSYTAHLENFHSDVIASLLDPDGLHGEGYTFLHLFIDFLNRCHDVPVKNEDYANSVVTRETGRIDIWIKDETSKQSIFIENKINDATDRDNQLKDYFEYAGDYPAKAIVYLSKDGRKLAPYNSVSVNNLVKNIAAFNNRAIDLYNGWLVPCLNECHKEDSRSVVHQYTKLIAHLGNNDMDNEIKEQFYQFVSKNNGLDAANVINNLIVHLPHYRAQRFADKTEDYLKRSPFKNRFKYQNNYYIFERFERPDGSYKLDVCFESNGRAYVVLWNTVKRDADGCQTVNSILKQIGLADKFNAPSRYNGMTAEFAISADYPSLEAVDNAVLELVNEVFEKLTILSQQPE